MSKNQASAQGSHNTECISFNVRNFTPKGSSQKNAYKILECEPDASSNKVFNTDVVDPTKFVEGLAKRPAALIDRNMVYAPGVDWYDRAKEKRQHIPAAVIAAWIEQGGKLIWRRSKMRGKRMQLQTPDALKGSNSQATELTMDDFEF